MSSPGARAVVVTGAAGGIGRAVVASIVAGGGRVVAVGRTAASLQALEAAHPGAVFALAADLSRHEDRESLLPRAREKLGALDGLVHGAGVVVREPYGSITEAALREQVEVHLVASLRLGESALVHLDPGGAVVLLSSNLAVRPLAESPVYSACKAAMVSVAQSLALAGGTRRIRVNAVLPGPVDTPMQTPERLAALASKHPLGRAGTPEDVAGAVLHLLEAPWTTGTALVVDGGIGLT